MPKKVKEQFDGLSPSDLTRIRSAVRKVWSYSYPKRLVVKRCLQKDGFSKCEKCGKIVPKIQVDHIQPIGKLEGNWIERMFVPSSQLMGLCKSPCHSEKTKAENKLRREEKKKK